MSMNDNKTTKQSCDCSIKKDLAVAACDAVDSVLTSVMGAKLFQKIALKVAQNADPAKIKQASGIVGSGIGAGLLLTGDFIPTLAQALDRVWAKKSAEAPVTEEPVEEAPVEAAPVEAVAEAPVTVEQPEAVAAMAPVEEKDDDDEDESFGFSTAGLDFFDAMENPEEYAALVEQESAGEIRIVTRYRRSFLSRLIQSQGEVQAYYTAVKNKLLSYKGIKARTSWGNESFNKGRVHVAKVSAKSKTLYLYLAIDPATLEESTYNFEDVSSKKKYESVPVLIKIKGPRKLNYALELIDSICLGRLALPEVKNFEAVDYAVAYRSTEELVNEGLVKKMVAGIPVQEFDTSVPPTQTETDVTVPSV